MDEVVSWLAEDDPEVDVFVRAAMAHLNVISVHPFRDGNGRISRIVAVAGSRPRRTRPRPSSSRSRSTSAATPRITTPPSARLRAGATSRSATRSGWVSFCLEAHIAQARQRLDQIEQAAVRWQQLEELAEAAAGRTGS